ncbi:hypothetical protein HPB50_027816 [Hyalomma asiaticum]|nr:hypothetical protein HPB50_027816 [Hyalomma asiaticum]
MVRSSQKKHQEKFRRDSRPDATNDKRRRSADGRVWEQQVAKWTNHPSNYQGKSATSSTSGRLQSDRATTRRAQRFAAQTSTHILLPEKRRWHAGSDEEGTQRPTHWTASQTTTTELVKKARTPPYQKDNDLKAHLWDNAVEVSVEKPPKNPVEIQGKVVIAIHAGGDGNNSTDEQPIGRSLTVAPTATVHGFYPSP